MTTARPQHMSNDPDTSDDLIAELAKLMAQDAQGERPAGASSGQPTGAVQASPQRQAAPAGASSQPAPAVDLGRAPQAAPTLVPEPFADWRERLKAKSGTEAAPLEVRREPVLSPEAQKPAAPVARAETPVVPDLDFGFGAPTTKPEPTRAAPAQPQPADRDAIADLIAAEMGAVHPQPAPGAAQAPQPTVARPQSAATPTVPTEPEAAAARPQAPRVNANVRQFTPVSARSGQSQPGKPVIRQLNLAKGEPPRDEPRMDAGVRTSPPPAAQQHGSGEPDAFSVAPVFGLGGKSATQAVNAPAQPAAERPSRSRDPIEEIENLIGEAVRVNLGDPEAAVQKAQGPSLLRRMTGRKAAGKEEKAEAAAEDAILAAAAVSGLDVGRVEPIEDAGEDFEGEVEPMPPRRRFSRQLVGPLVATTLLVASGFGLYSVLGLGGGGTDQAPLLTAEAGAVKEEAIVTPSASAGQRSAVFDEIDGVAASEPEQLVSREETPAEETTEVAVVSEEGLANRKVRTVTVRPDGTIVSGDTSLAASELLPVDRPNVPELPGASVEATDLLAGIAGTQIGANGLAPEANTAVSAASDVAAAADTNTTGTLPEVEATALAAETAPLTTESGPPIVVDVNGQVIEGAVAPIPLPRPSFRTGPSAALETTEDGATATTSVAASSVNALIDVEPVVLLTGPAEQPADLSEEDPTAAVAAIEAVGEPATEAAEPVQVASVEPAETAPAQAAAYVQLVSQNTEKQALASRDLLTSKYESLFEGASLEIQRSDLGQRGVVYRVRLPAASARSAKEICSKIKASGGDCFAL